ncbi:YybH family protein [Cystobacter fuscus]|uniref:YybH family protein n=1 Tax=Cystobacter fuscus TaxID=43 RepID=UPI002B2E707E|nr:nuclear transport factor 2 family protein [Cystobacter fuscus]
MNVRPLFVTVLLVLSACGPRYIPGTQINDTEDTRAILKVMERYRAAVEARDAKAILALVSPNFRDNAGTEDPVDDLTSENLAQALPALLSRVDAPRLEMDVRRVDVKRDGWATVIYYWNASWRAPGLMERPQRDSELEQMVLQREDGEWRIVTGI